MFLVIADFLSTPIGFVLVIKKKEQELAGAIAVCSQVIFCLG